ncbi:SWIM zinc finger family protein [Lentzea sp. NPDC003310]
MCSCTCPLWEHEGRGYPCE